MKSYIDKLAIVVISTDSYSDSWDIFFESVNKNWSKASLNKYLFTDSLDYNSHGVITINPIKNEYSNALDWGGRLLSCLDQINEENILFFLEDYILIKNVNNIELKSAIEYFFSKNIDFMTLGTHDTNRLSHRSNTDRYVKVKKFTKYRITTAPAIWKKEYLKKYLIKGLNPWQFEILGSYFSFFCSGKLFSLNKMFFNLSHEIIPYFINNGLDSAIVRGKWQSEIKKHIEEKHIQLIEKRGFYDPLGNGISKIDTIKKVLSNPFFIFRYFFKVIKS